MKKLLLSAAVVLGAIFSQAQTTISYTAFGSSIPGGWSQQLTSVDAGWQFGTSFQSNMQSYAPAQGDDAFVDDWDNNSPTNAAGHDTLKTGVMNCSAYTHVFLSMNFMFWIDDGNETSNIIVSTNGGVTWAAAAALSNTNGGWADSAIFDISALAAGHASVMVGFTYFNGYPSSSPYTAVGMAVAKVDIYAPASYDVLVASQTQAGLVQVGSAYNFSGVTDNLGGTTITSMDMNYSVNNGATVTQNIPSIAGFSSLTAYNWSMNSTSSAWTPSAEGSYTVRYWASNLNGANSNTNTDTLVTVFSAYDSIVPKTVQFEEFSCASCDPCLYAMTNIDTVSENCAAYCNTVRYHWYFPGQDMINNETSTLVNTRFETYYGQNGVPVGEVDGAYYYPGYGHGLSSATIQAEAAIGSPFKIDVGQATYDPTTKKYWCAATIKAFGTFAAGLTAQVVLTEDSVNFSTDQSVEDPQSYFAPPIGSGAGNDDPDWMYPLVLKFPDAVEDMLPTVNGTTLSAFTPESSQTINVSWTQNHPWAAERAAYPYDSTLTQHFTIFVQTNNAIGSIPAKYVFQSKRVLIKTATGVEDLSNPVSFEMYPNPTSGATNIQFNLDKEQNVNVALYNTLGQRVYNDNEGVLSDGQHLLTIPAKGLSAGIYFVTFTTDNTTTTKKLIIQ